MEKETHHAGRKILCKFFLIASLFFAAVLVLGILLYREKGDKIDLVEKQITGLEYIRKVIPLLDSIRLYRYETNESSSTFDTLNCNMAIAKDFDALLEYSDANAKYLALEPADLEKIGKEELYPYNLKRDFKALEDKPCSSDYIQLEEKLNELIDTAVDNAQLMTLFDSTIARLVDSALYELQNSKERMDKILLVLDKNEEVKALSLLQKNNVEYIETNLRKSMSNSWHIRKNVEPALVSWKEDMNMALHLINHNNRVAFQKSYPQFLQSQEVFQKTLFDEIEELLYCSKTEIAQTIQKNLLVTLFFVAMAITLALMLSKRISVPLSQIITVAEELKKGHLDTRVHIPPASSGLKELALSINLMAESLQEHIKAVDETAETMKKIIDQITSAATNTQYLLNEQKNRARAIEESISLSTQQKKTFFSHLKTLHQNVHSAAKLLSEIKNRTLQTSETMQKIENTEGALKQKINLLIKKTEASKSVSQLITSIVSDINLVSMNASIEAEKEAHSTVVRHLTANIRKLSDQVHDASEKIDQELKSLEEAITTTNSEFSLFHGATTESFRILSQMRELSLLGEQSLLSLQEQLVVVDSSDVSLSQMEGQLISKLEEMQAGFTEAHTTVQQFSSCVDQLKQLAAQPSHS